MRLAETKLVVTHPDFTEEDSGQELREQFISGFWDGYESILSSEDPELQAMSRAPRPDVRVEGESVGIAWVYDPDDADEPRMMSLVELAVAATISFVSSYAARVNVEDYMPSYSFAVHRLADAPS